MTTTPHIWIVVFSEVSRDPRVMRQLHTLSRDYRVTAFGHGADPCVENVDFVELTTVPPRTICQKIRQRISLAARLFEGEYWTDARVRSFVSRASRLGRPDLVVANDLMPLPASLKVSQATPVLLDAHEYFPRQFEDNMSWRMFFLPFNKHLCRRYLPPVAGMTTVCNRIAEEYERRYPVSPAVITNAPSYEDLEPTPVDGDRIRLIHHGGAMRSRRLDLTIEMMDYLDARFTLDLMLVPGEPGHLEELEHLASRNPRIRFRPPVDMPKIAREINGYDVGVFLLPPTSFSYRYALPNKFFEFIQARLAIAIGPSPEMAAIVRDKHLGVIAPTFQPKDIAESLMTITASDIRRFKTNANHAASELNAEQNTALLKQIIQNLLARH